MHVGIRIEHSQICSLLHTRQKPTRRDDCHIVSPVLVIVYPDTISTVQPEIVGSSCSSLELQACCVSCYSNRLFSSAILVAWSTIVVTPSVCCPSILVFPSQRLQPLLLGVRVYVGTNDEADEVEEWHPDLVREESLREGKRERRGDPGHLHHGHETGAHSGTNLMESASASDDSHGREVDSILDRGDLEDFY